MIEKGSYMIAQALRIAAQAHEGQTDKGGEDYILHPIEVMQIAASLVPLRARSFRRDVMVVAILHDAIEDCPVSERAVIAGEIASEFPQQIYESVMALTKKKDDAYEEYIERVAAYPIARIVKIADLTHNMDVTRLPQGDIGQKDFERWDKYRRALVRLKRED